MTRIEVDAATAEKLRAAPAGAELVGTDGVPLGVLRSGPREGLAAGTMTEEDVREAKHALATSIRFYTTEDVLVEIAKTHGPLENRSGSAA